MPTQTVCMGEQVRHLKTRLTSVLPPGMTVMYDIWQPEVPTGPQQCFSPPTCLEAMTYACRIKVARNGCTAHALVASGCGKFHTLTSFIWSCRHMLTGESGGYSKAIQAKG